MGREGGRWWCEAGGARARERGGDESSGRGRCPKHTPCAHKQRLSTQHTQHTHGRGPRIPTHGAPLCNPRQEGAERGGRGGRGRRAAHQHRAATQRGGGRRPASRAHTQHNTHAPREEGARRAATEPKTRTRAHTTSRGGAPTRAPKQNAHAHAHSNTCARHTTRRTSPAAVPSFFLFCCVFGSSPLSLALGASASLFSVLSARRTRVRARLL